jgi:hypothetical protein
VRPSRNNTKEKRLTLLRSNKLKAVAVTATACLITAAFAAWLTDGTGNGLGQLDGNFELEGIAVGGGTTPGDPCGIGEDCELLVKVDNPNPDTLTVTGIKRGDVLPLPRVANGQNPDCTSAELQSIMTLNPDGENVVPANATLPPGSTEVAVVGLLSLEERPDDPACEGIRFVQEVTVFASTQ